MKDIILTDVDGVLVKWQSGLPFFASKYGIKSEGINRLVYTEDFIPFGEIFGPKFSEAEAKQLFDLYNHSDFIKYLSGYEDALKVVNQLKEQYDFISVSALSSNMDAILNRRFNLNALFPEAFIDFFQCNSHDSKHDLFFNIQKKYKDRNIVTFIDDLPRNVEAFNEVFPGTPSVHMVRGSSRDVCMAKECVKIESWNQLFKGV